MDESPREDRIQTLWQQRGTGVQSVLEETVRLSRYLAEDLRIPDAQGEASGAFLHLLRNLPVSIDRFYEGDVPNLAWFRRWSRVVMRNHLLKRLRTLKDSGKYADGSELLEASVSTDAEARIDSGRRLTFVLSSILALRAKWRDLALGRLAGFSGEQLEPWLPMTRASLDVTYSRIRKEMRDPGEPGCSRPYLALEPPDEDPLLATEDTPHLVRTLCHLDRFGDQMLSALRALETAPYLSFFCRLAGFWDSIIAAVTSVPISRQRQCVGQARTRLETLLARDASGISQSTSGSQFRPPGDGTMSRSTPKSVAVSSSYGLTWAQVQTVQGLLPEAAVAVMLADPGIQDALARGRRTVLSAELAASCRVAEAQEGKAARDTAREAAREPTRESVSEPASRTSWLEALWDQAKQGLGEACGWLVIPPGPALQMRSESPVVGTSTRALVVAFGPNIKARAHDHCLIWQQEGETLRLAYPRLPDDPTEALALDQRRLVLRVQPGASSATCLVTWLNAATLEQLAGHGGSREERLSTWLKARLEQGDLAGVGLYRMSFPVKGDQSDSSREGG